MGKDKSYVAVRRGREVRVCEGLDEAMPLLDGFPSCWFSAFPTHEEAEAYLRASSVEAHAMDRRYAPYSRPRSPSPDTSQAMKPLSQLAVPASTATSKPPSSSPQPKREVIDISSDVEEVSPAKPKPRRSQVGPLQSYDPYGVAAPGPRAGPSANFYGTSQGNGRAASSSQPAFLSQLPDDDEEAAMNDMHHSSAVPQLNQHEFQVPIPSTDPDAAPVTLSAEQQAILQLALNGQNVFFTGSAGTGKSVLMRELIRQLKGKTSNVHVTASTGMAASNLGAGATTLHSFAGLGLAKEKKEDLFGKLLGPALKGPRNRWLGARVLVIDEISMVDGSFWDKLEWVARQIRKSQLPFGGIQVVATGDFYQLPPVPDYNGKQNKTSCFAFKATSWRSVFKQVYKLKNVYRQQDARFVTMLNSFRLGIVTPESMQLMRSLDRKVHYDDGIEPTSLYSRRYEVDNQNAMRLRVLQGESKVFEARDTIGPAGFKKNMTREQCCDKLDKNTRIAARLELKIGAQVMLCKNLSDCDLVNGSVGIVTHYATGAQAIQDEGVLVAEIEDAAQPKRSAPTFDMIALHGKAKARAKSHLDVDPDLVPPGEWPVVEFRSAISGHTSKFLIPPCEFEVSDAEGKVECTRFGIPLLLAWALTVHKSQGQTIERLKIDLSTVFEVGQAYVAISRGVSLDTLEVKGFTNSAVKVHPDVLEWSKELL